LGTLRYFTVQRKKKIFWKEKKGEKSAPANFTPVKRKKKTKIDLVRQIFKTKGYQGLAYVVWIRRENK
jgi:hypothetical protein